MPRFVRLCVILTAVLFALPAAAQLTAIKAGKVVDPETGKTATHQVILVEGTRIKAVGENVAIPPGAKVIVSSFRLDRWQNSRELRCVSRMGS